MFKKILLLILVCFYHTVVFALDMQIPTAYVDKISALVMNAKTGKIVYSHDANTPRLVASNMKLVTTAVALDKLPTNFRWHTQLAYTGSIESRAFIADDLPAGKNLNGNLYLIGGGDPTLDDKAIEQILRRLKQLKINTIDGDIIIDNSIFNSKPTYSMLKEEHYDSDTVLPEGIIINGNLSRFQLSINDNVVSLNSNLYKYSIINKLNVDKKIPSCEHLYDLVETELDKQSVILSGSVSPKCDGEILSYNMLTTQDYTTMVLKRALNKLGIRYTGEFIYKKAPLATHLIYDYSSPSLEDVLTKMNQYSINLSAETILLSLGAYTTNNNDTYKQSKQVYLEYMQTNDLLNSKFELENAAGLSRNEYMSPTNLAHLLWTIAHSSSYKNFRATLPIAGQNGTLKYHFVNFGKQVRFKTGTLNDTSSYAGYFYAKNGTPYIVVITANGIDTNDKTQMLHFNSWVNSLLVKLN